MKFSDNYRNDHFGLSFELFPPKSDAGEAALYGHVEQLLAFQPDFITCTYGAGGSTQEKTLAIITEVKQRFGLPVASHLTCVGSTADQLRSYLTRARDQGVDAIVALRGDPPKGENEFRQTVGGLKYANDLVQLIAAEFPQFGVAVAGYPETHQEAKSPADDLANLKRKVDSGGQVVITQLFYQNKDYWRFLERCRELDIDAPIVPGVLPVTDLAQIQRIASLCGAQLPAEFVERLAARGDDKQWQFDVGVDFAAAQVQELVDGGAPGVHFYVLNKSQATAEVLRKVSLPQRA